LTHSYLLNNEEPQEGFRVIPIIHWNMF